MVNNRLVDTRFLIALQSHPIIIFHSHLQLKQSKTKHFKNSYLDSNDRDCSHCHDATENDELKINYSMNQTKVSY